MTAHIRMGRGEHAESVEHFLALGLRKGGDARHGRRAIHDLGGREGLRERDVFLFQRTKERRALEDGAPFPGLVIGPLRIDRVDERIERRDPGGAPVAHVPDEPEPSGRCQDPVEFGERLLAVEPVERLRRDDRVGRGITQGHVLGGAGERDRAGDLRRQALTHLGERLDGDERRSARNKGPGQLAGAGSDIDDDPSGRDPKLADEDVDGERRILRPDALVEIGGRRETLGDVVVKRVPAHGSIVSSVMSRHVLVVGPLAYDDVSTPLASRSRVLGGSAAYASIAAAKHAPTMLVSVCGSDLGENELEVLRAASVDLSGLERRVGPTLRWSGAYSEEFSRSVVRNVDLGVVVGWRPSVPAAGRAAKHVFLTNTDPTIQSGALDQLRPDVALLDTMDEWISGRRAELERIIGRVTVVSLNEHELQLFTGSSDLARGAALIIARGPRAVLVKRGARGATVVTATDAFTVPAYPAAVVDPTGAGDALGGAFIGRLSSSGLTGDAGYRDALIAGVAAASFAVGSFGLDALDHTTPADLDARRVALEHRSGTGGGASLYEGR